MSPLEIALIIIGIIVIVISCRLVGHTKNEPSQLLGKPISSIEERLTEADKKKLMDKMNEMLSEATEESIVRADDALSKISNEKIMAVHEFSDQIIEKIKRNHEEVVFLYNMLNDKEKELKAAVREIDTSKKKIQDIIETKAENDRLQSVQKTKSQVPAKAASPVKQKASEPAELSHEVTTVSGGSQNSNSQILALYSQGRNVVEISKLLGLGQGEVKLVIDLFKGKK